MRITARPPRLGTSESLELDEDHEANVRTTANAFDAALDGGVNRVVVASSAHVVGIYNRDDGADMESTVADPTDTVDTESAVRPGSFYGDAKAAVEGLAVCSAERYDIEILGVRIGWLITAE